MGFRPVSVATLSSYAARHAELRAAWLERGAKWHSASDPPPPGWDPFAQLKNLGS